MKICGVFLIFVVGSSFDVFTVQGITLRQSPEVAVYGQEVLLSCTIGEIKGEVKWLYNGNTYFDCSYPYCAGMCHQENEHYVFDFDIRQGVTTATIPKLYTSNHGNWTCQHGDDTESVRINATHKPAIKFTSPQQGADLEEGEIITLECVVDTDKAGVLDVSIWRFREKLNSTSNNTLEVSVEVDCADHVFECTAYNDLEVAETKFLNFSVICGLELGESDTSVEAVVGSNASLVVKFIGYPRPKIDWYRIDGESSTRMTGFRTANKSDHNSATMTIIDVHFEDAGRYEVSLSGMGGTDKKQRRFDLKVIDPPIEENPCKSIGAGTGIAIGITVTLVLVATALGVAYFIRRRRSSYKGVVNNVVGQEEYENVEYTKDKPR